jgi:hypothetical protein
LESGTEAEAYVCPWNFPDVEEFIIPSYDDSISWTFSFSLLFHGEKTSRESREWGWDVIILPLVHLPAFDRDFWDRRYNILDRFDKLGRLFVHGMEVCNQVGIIPRERIRCHGRWWEQGWSSGSMANIDCTWCSDSESQVVGDTMRIQ